jgi:putative ABC transport system substrate-binding protein
VRRRDALRLLGACSAAAAGISSAAAKPRVVILAVGTTMTEGWRPRLAKWFAEDGLVDGRDVEMEFLDMSSITEEAEVERRARPIVASRPAAIMMHNEPEVFHRLTRDVPIVFYNFDTDPVRLGLVQSMRRPGGNITGSTSGAVGLVPKTCEIYKALRPKLKRIGILADSASLGAQLDVAREVQGEAARRLGVDRVDIVIPLNASAKEVEKAILASKVDAIDVTFSMDDVPWALEAMKIVERARILASWDNLWRVRQGGLLSVDGDYIEAIRESVRIVAQVLRGTKPADIPVYESRRVVISINLGTARAMNLTIPASVLIQATNLIRP